MAATERECLQCGETPESIKAKGIALCGIEGGYEYRELEYEWPRHRWVDWTNSELGRAGLKPEAFDKHRRTPAMQLEWVACEDLRRGHTPAVEADIDVYADRVGQCTFCGRDTTAPSTPNGASS